MKSSIASLDPTTASIVLRKLASIDTRGSQSSSSSMQQSSNAICNNTTCSSSTNSLQPSIRTSTFQSHSSSSLVNSNAKNLHMHTMASLAHVHSSHISQSSSSGAQSHLQSSLPTQTSSRSQSEINSSNTSTGHGGIPLMSLHAHHPHHHHHHHHHQQHHHSSLHNARLTSPSHHSPSSIGLISPNSRTSYLPSSPLLTHHLVTSIAAGNNAHFQSALNNGLTSQLIYRPNPLLLRPSTDGATTLTTTSRDNSISTCNSYNQLILMPSGKITSKNRSNGSTRVGNSTVLQGTVDTSGRVSSGKVVSGQIWRPHIQLCDGQNSASNVVMTRSIDHNHSNSSALSVQEKVIQLTESNNEHSNGQQVPSNQVDNTDVQMSNTVVTIRSKIDERISKLYEFNKRIHHDSMDDTDEDDFELDSDLEEREIFSSLSSDEDITIDDLPRIQLTPPPMSQPLPSVSTESSVNRGRRTRSRSKKQQQQQSGTPVPSSSLSSGAAMQTIIPVRETKNSFLSRLDLVPSVDAVDFKFQKFLKSRIYYERPSCRRNVLTGSCTVANGTNGKRSNSLTSYNGNASVSSSNYSNNGSKRIHQNNQMEKRNNINSSVQGINVGESDSPFNETCSSVSSILPPMVPTCDAKVAFFSDILQLKYLPPSTSFENIQKSRELNWLNITNLTRDIRNNIPRNNISIEQFNLWLDWYKVNEEKFKREIRIKRTKEAMARKEMAKLTTEIKLRFDKLRSLVANHTPIRLEHVDHLTNSLDKLANCLCSHEKQ